MKLATFAANLKFEDISKTDLEWIRLDILDTIGCGLFGSTRSWGTLLAETVEEMASKGRSVVWGRRSKLHPAHAVLINGTFVHGSELDDTHQPTRLHLGSATFTSALAAAEHVGGLSGEALLTATAAAFEAQITLRSLMGRSHPAMGWNGTGTCGTIGSAIAAAKILGLDAKGIANAIGISGTCPSGLQAGQKSMVKRTFPGRAGFQGVLGAVLASKGFTGTSTLIEDNWGFCSTLSAPGDYDLTRAETVGNPFKLSGMGIKAYPFGIGIHTALDALKKMMKERNVTSDIVEKVAVRQPPLDAKFREGMEPKAFGDAWSAEKALMSMHYAVAALLVEGEVFIDQTTEEKVRDPKILDLANRVEVIGDPELDKAKRGSAVVELFLKNGTVYKSEIHSDAKGTPGNPMTNAEVEDKFTKLARTVLDQRRVEQIRDTVRSLEQIDDIGQLTRLLGK